MILLGQAFLAVASASPSASLRTTSSFDPLGVHAVDLIPQQQTQIWAVPVLVPPVCIQYVASALSAGGFVLPANAHEPYSSTLHPFFFTSCGGLQRRRTQCLDEKYCFRDSNLWIGHSKGGKLVATWMAESESSTTSASRSRSSNISPGCCLIEPVDVDPPRGPHEIILALESLR
jgi:hypothetical protein